MQQFINASLAACLVWTFKHIPFKPGPAEVCPKILPQSATNYRVATELDGTVGKCSKFSPRMVPECFTFSSSFKDLTP